MLRQGRSLYVVALVSLATAVVGASVAWACTGPGFGTPSAPAAPPSDPPPPSPTQQPPQGSAPLPAPSAPSEAPATEAPPASPSPDAQGTAPARTGDSNSTSGAVGGSPAPNRGSVTQPTPQPAPVSPVSPGEQFAAREDGFTAGVVTEGGQAVFADPAAGKKQQAGAPQPAAGSPSERTATGDAWSGFSSGNSTGGSAAPVASLGADGSSSSTLGIAILGLGLAGTFGTFLVLAASRRRRASVDPSGSDRGRGRSGR